MKKGKNKDAAITADEKEMLRRLMETPGIEHAWDFFEGMNTHVPPPEFFMRGEPERRYGKTKKFLKVSGYVASVLICAVVLATFMVPETADADKTSFQMLVDNIRNGFVEVKPDSEDMELPAYTVTIDDEADIETTGRDVFPELLVPSYIPEGYSFSVLCIQKDEGDSDLSLYKYVDTSGNVLKIEYNIVSNNAGTVFNNLIEGSSNNGELCYQYDDVNNFNILTVWKSDREHVHISGVVDDDTLKRIYKGLE